MTDKIVNQQVLGSIMKRPQLLSEVDKYSLEITDFSSRFEKTIFLAIRSLYKGGAGIITPLDVENCIEPDATAKALFAKYNGIEYLQDIEDLVNVENFPYYYSKLKKMNLLRDLKKQGIDTSEFYIEDLTNPKADEVNTVFEQLTTKDICEAVKRRLLKLEANYAVSEEVKTQTAASGMKDFISELRKKNNFGTPIQGNIYTQIINGAEKGALTIRSGSSGLGKALPNSTVIPTPSGFKTVGEITKGDYLFDAFGRPTRVLEIYPQGQKEVWEITFKDGRKAKCNSEHLWSFCTSSQKTSSKNGRKFYTETLEEISRRPLKKEGVFNILVPNTYAVEYDEKEYFIKPYVFGLLLGDGSFRQHPNNKSFQYSSEDSELPRAVAEIQGWELKRGSHDNYTWYFSLGTKNVWVEDVLKDCPELINAYSEDKYIPQSYMFGSIQQRFDLLAGLLDSDGTVDKKGRVAFFTISKKMAYQVQELAYSLGMTASIAIDDHKNTNRGYIVHISGRPVDKIHLFKLSRKRKLICDWYDNSKRKESNDFNPIVEIKNLGYSEEMTCFYVDNKEHLFLMNDYIVTHNTRQAVGDACMLAYPVRYNAAQHEWEAIGNCEQVLFVITEQTFKQIQGMILAYLTDIDESRFKYDVFTEEEEKVVNQALSVMEQFEENFIIIKVPNPTIELIKTLIRENCLTKNIKHVFYDYVFIGPALLGEFRGFSLRNDEILLMFTTALKDLAVELQVSMFTSTQVNASADDNREIRNEASLAGGRSTINKADNGAIMARPKKEELETLAPLVAQYGQPNVVTDIFKVRSGEWTQVRIWSQINLGRMRKRDLFLTDSNLEPIMDFQLRDLSVRDWDDATAGAVVETLNILNGKDIK